MKKLNRILTALLATSLFFAPLAEAKRAGSGKSHGMTRQTASQPAPARPMQQPMQQPAQQTAPQKSGSNIGGMLAAGAAGAAVGALAANAMADDDKTIEETSQQQEEEGLNFGWIFWVILAGLAFFLFRRFSSKKKLATASGNPYAPNHQGSNAPFGASSPTGFSQKPSAGTNIFGQPVGGNLGSQSSQNFGGVYTNNGQTLPDGTEPAAFLRIARQRFNHIQSMNNANNINEIRRYLTADLYQSMYNDIMANQDQDVAEFSNLNAMVAESATENGQYIVSVRFTGTVSEDLNSLPQPFSEIWHFVKPVNSTEDWLVAGIQQD